MEQLAKHVDFQIVNSQTRVKHSLDAMAYSDAGVNASMSIIMSADRPEVKLRNFEVAANYLLPYDPLAKSKSSKIHKDDYASMNDGTENIWLALASRKNLLGRLEYV